MLNLSIPEHIKPLRDKVLQFVEEKVYPQEELMHGGDGETRKKTLSDLMQQAKDAGLWALGHPKDIGGAGLPFMDYVFINAVVGRSDVATAALGTHSLQDSIMLNRYASDRWRDTYLKPLVEGTIFPSFGMTEPDVAGSDPTKLQTTGVLEGESGPDSDIAMPDNHIRAVWPDHVGIGDVAHREACDTHGALPPGLVGRAPGVDGAKHRCAYERYNHGCTKYLAKHVLLFLVRRLRAWRGRHRALLSAIGARARGAGRSACADAGRSWSPGNWRASSLDTPVRGGARRNKSGKKCGPAPTHRGQARVTVDPARRGRTPPCTAPAR